MAVVGYARTSTVDQNAGLDDQREELKRAGCERVYAEQISGVDATRPELSAALAWCRDGDVFCVTKPDRLARSTVDLLNIVDDLTRRGVSVRILSMGVDTSTPTGKLMLTMLGGIAEFERSLMLERQRAGIRAAREAGKYKGRKPTARLQSAEVIALDAEGVGAAEIARRLNMGRSSVYRILDAQPAEAA